MEIAPAPPEPVNIQVGITIGDTVGFSVIPVQLDLVGDRINHIAIGYCKALDSTTVEYKIAHRIQAAVRCGCKGRRLCYCWR